MVIEPISSSKEYQISVHRLFITQATRTATLPSAKNTPQILSNNGDISVSRLLLGAINRNANKEKPTVITSKRENIVIVLALNKSFTPYSLGFRHVTRYTSQASNRATATLMMVQTYPIKRSQNRADSCSRISGLLSTIEFQYQAVTFLALPISRFGFYFAFLFPSSFLTAALRLHASFTVSINCRRRP